MTLGEFARPEVERRRDLLEKALIQSLPLPEVEAVHKVRTSWRRLEAAVHLLPWLVQRKAWDGFRGRMKSVMSAAAQLRDRDNAIERLRAFEALCLTMHGQRRLWEPEFHRRVDAMFPWQLPLRGVFPKSAGQDAAAFAARTLKREERQRNRERAKLHSGSDTEEWHRFRIYTKRYRYVLEFFSPLSDAYEMEAIRIRDQQDTLGAVEDVVAAMRVARAASPERKLICEPLDFLKAELRHKLEMLELIP
jgi:CHAD domain-containing protein